MTIAASIKLSDIAACIKLPAIAAGIKLPTITAIKQPHIVAGQCWHCLR